MASPMNASRSVFGRVSVSPDRPSILVVCFPNTRDLHDGGRGGRDGRDILISRNIHM